MKKQYFYIQLHPPGYPRNSEQVDKDMRKAWEILTSYFAQKSDFFTCYFSDQEFFLRELKLIKPFLGEFKIAPEFGPGCLKGECKITLEFSEALIKSPTFEGISPLFDFKFYKNEELVFDCADHGCDISFWANEQEQEEIESLLGKNNIYFELQAQFMGK